MAQVAFSIRMDECLKRDFSSFCENVGMTMSTAFVVFAKAAVRERRFPFEITEGDGRRSRICSDGLNALRKMRSKVQELDLPEPSADEINEMIAEARRARCSRR